MTDKKSASGLVPAARADLEASASMIGMLSSTPSISASSSKPISMPPVAPSATPTATNVIPPAWFQEAVETVPETLDVRMTSPSSGEEKSINCLRWGASKTKRALILVHGGSAHAAWYRMVAPFFLNEFDVVAVSNSGNGDSSHCERYAVQDWADEIIQVARKLQLFNTGVRPAPYLVCHSLGCYVGSEVALRLPSATFGGIVLVDGAVRNVEEAKMVRDRLVAMRKNDPLTQPRSGWVRNPVTLAPVARLVRVGLPHCLLSSL